MTILLLVTLATWVVVAQATYYKPVQFDDDSAIRYGDIKSGNLKNSGLGRHNTTSGDVVDVGRVCSDTDYQPIKFGDDSSARYGDIY